MLVAQRLNKSCLVDLHIENVMRQVLGFGRITSQNIVRRLHLEVSKPRVAVYANHGQLLEDPDKH